MLIEQRRENGESVAVIECKEFLGSIDIYPQYGFCIFDAEKDPVRRTERCPSIGDEIRCHVLSVENSI